MNFNEPRSKCNLCGQPIASRQLRNHRGSVRCISAQKHPCPTCGDPMRYESVFEVWICDTHTRFYVDVTTFPDEEVVKTLGPYHSYRQAVRALGGVSTNMNHDRFTARLRPDHSAERT